MDPSRNSTASRMRDDLSFFLFYYENGTFEKDANLLHLLTNVSLGDLYLCFADLEKRMAKVGGMTSAVNVGIAVQADWENRVFISNISLSVRRLFEFVLQFESATRSKLSTLNEKLDTLERRLEMLEVQLSAASA